MKENDKEIGMMKREKGRVYMYIYTYTSII